MSTSRSEQLKTEGNALFVKEDYSGVYQRYTEALKLDEKNAILYSNRAACSLKLNRCQDAHADALKATELDAGFPKAWGRLGSARAGLRRYEQAVEAFDRAIAALPAENLKSTERNQKDQYIRERAGARARLEVTARRVPARTVVVPDAMDITPWNRAFALIPDLNASNNWQSSAWVITGAYRDWERAMNAMHEGKIQKMATGYGFLARQGVIESFTNAIVADTRVFHISNPKFLEMYSRQMICEIQDTKAWTDGGAREIMEEAPKRLNTQGWNSLRPALSLTVRGWIMRAFVEDGLKGNSEVALEFYTSALEVLRWGSTLWKDVPDQMRGAIFQTTFIRAVKCLRLDVCMKVCLDSPGKLSPEELLVGVNELLAELATTPTTPSDEDYGVFLSFYRYPIGQAYAIQGFYHNQKAKRIRSSNGMTDEARKEYSEAADRYLKAALIYPIDDESHVWWLHMGLNARFDSTATVGSLLSILEDIGRSIPAMKRIWEFSADAKSGRDDALNIDLKLHDMLLDGIQSGEVTKETCVKRRGTGNKYEIVGR